MNTIEVKEAMKANTTFSIPKHVKRSQYPPFINCSSAEGKILFVYDRTTVQALIIVCNVCGERFGSSISEFPDLDRMSINHKIITEGELGPLLPEIEEVYLRESTATDNLVKSILRKDECRRRSKGSQ